MDWYDWRRDLDRPSKRTMRGRIYSPWMGRGLISWFYQSRNDGWLSWRMWWLRQRRSLCNQMQGPHSKRQRRFGKSHITLPVNRYWTSGLAYQASQQAWSIPNRKISCKWNQKMGRKIFGRMSRSQIWKTHEQTSQFHSKGHSKIHSRIL